MKIISTFYVKVGVPVEVLEREKTSHYPSFAYIVEKNIIYIEGIVVVFERETYFTFSTSSTFTIL